MHTFWGAMYSHTSECHATTAMYHHGTAATVCESGAMAIEAIAFASAKAKSTQKQDKILETHWTRSNNGHLKNCASAPKLAKTSGQNFPLNPHLFSKQRGVVFKTKYGLFLTKHIKTFPSNEVKNACVLAN
jgi:broad specificity polyphosphatase/5'/3'-nucleotidase SurE